MNRLEIINSLISKNGYKSYLEIGCQKNKTFNNVIIDNKIGVDPVSGGTIQMSSNDYFDSLAEDVVFDIVFIDGLHHKEQVLKDIKNSLLHLAKNGTIVVHDCLPTSFEMQVVPRETKAWTGDVWKAIVELKKTKTTIKIAVVEIDMGCGIIQFGKQEKLVNTGKVDWSGFEKNKKEWLNLISWEDFQKQYL
jgi:hypothetical protein